MTSAADLFSVLCMSTGIPLPSSLTVIVPSELILTFIFSLVISIYHFGIEQGFFPESSVCGTKDFNENITKEDLLELLSQERVSCKDVTFRIFGLSLTSINIVISLFLILTLTKIFTNYEKKR